jgi:hypothetical protein
LFNSEAFIYGPFSDVPPGPKSLQTVFATHPSSAEAHASLALVLFHFNHDWNRAAEFQEAIRCDPLYAFSYHGYAKIAWSPRAA